MANTYSQISIQAVFAVKGRENIIANYWRDDLHKYISGIINKEAKSLAVEGWQNHVHIFFGLPLTLSIAKLLQTVKANSSKWVNEQNFINGKFQWQEGYGAFSYSKNQRDAVIKYVMSQEEHHKQKNFRTEYLEILNTFEIEFDPKYIFEFYE